ncbi:DMT family transporter (plasmid) [Thioclava sp. 'Guangxiensis']|uniref:DMT family transporter n=1 Tax=Thioclava sp. 'Guangxiensis' TaxID=3149044 RepID=UPI0032C481D1
MRSATIHAQRALPLGALVALIGICIIWAGNAVMLRYAIGIAHLPPIHIAAGRFIVVAIILSPLLLKRIENLPRIFLAGFLIGACHFGFLMMGYARITAVASATILQLAIPATALLSMIFRREPLSWSRLGLVGLATIAVIIAVQGQHGGNSLDPYGIAYMVLATLALAGGSVLMAGCGPAPALVIQAWTSLGSALILSLIATWVEPNGLAQILAQPLLSIEAIVLPAIIVTVIAHTAYYHFLRSHPPSLVSAMTILFPVLTIIFGATFLGEILSWQFAIGTFCALVLVTLMILRPQHPRLQSGQISKELS